MKLANVRPLSFYTKRSSGLHILLVLLACGLSWFSWNAGEKQRKINIKLIQSSVRVDMVALPQRTLKELAAIQSRPASVAAKKEEVAPAPKRVEVPDKGNEFLKKGKVVKKKSLAELLKGYSAKKEVAKKVKKVSQPQEGLSNKEKRLLEGLIKSGNKVQEGDSLVGNGSAEVSTAVESYARKLSQVIKPFWTIPSYLADKELQTRIRVFISSEGRVVRATVYESSGDEEYDKRALEAVKKASPFPVPEEKISKSVLSGDILLGFPL